MDRVISAVVFSISEKVGGSEGERGSQALKGFLYSFGGEYYFELKLPSFHTSGNVEAI